MDNPDPTQFITILAHKAALVDQQAAFDSVISEKDERIKAIETTQAAKDVEIAAAKKAFDELFAYKTTMEATVSAVLQSGDPAQYEALAREFLTPAEEKARQEKLAKIAALKAEAAALEAALTV